MPRTLDPAVASEKDETATSPAVVLRIDLADPVGTKYYSDRTVSVPGLTIEPRIVECGPLASHLAAGRRPAVTDVRLVLRDDDGALAACLDQVEFQGSAAVVYQHFEGLAAGTMTPLLVGVVTGPVEKREREATVAFDVTDVSRKWMLDVGHAARSEDFPKIDPADEGRMLPVVFGRAGLSRGLCVRSGRKGELLAGCGREDGTLYISGFEDLPDGTALAVEIGRERLAGTISGVVFTATARGGGVIASGTTTHATGRQSSIRDENLAGEDNEYVGHLLRIFIDASPGPGDIPYSYAFASYSRLRDPPTSGYEHRLILRFDASTGTIEYWPPFTIEGWRSEEPVFHVTGWGHVRLIGANTPYIITTLAASHRAGDEVREVVEGGRCYVLNDAPSARVDTVYVYGRRVPKPVVKPRETVALGGGVVGVLGSQALGVEDLPDTGNRWIPVAPEFYSVNLSDETSFPELGRPVTTVTFLRDPGALPGIVLAKSEVRADLHGVESAGDGTGTIVENPADVIREMLLRWGGLDEQEDIDAASFETAAAALERTRFAFTLEKMRPLPELVAELASQARSVIRWREGRVTMRVLPRDAGEADHELDAATREEGSFSLAWDESEDVVTAIVAAFTEAGEPRELIVRDEAAEAAWGVRAQRLDMWAFGEARYVREAARFWLERLCTLRKRARLATFLQGLAVEPGDVVALTASELGEGTFLGEVQSVRHVPGSGRDGRIDRIEMELRLPVWAGCETSCEVACESACESACEAACESACEAACELSCETNCQNTCQLDCAAAAESLCQSACMSTSCEVACEVFVTGIDGWGCAACESACQVSCEAGCESLCEALCESACEVACESGEES